MTFLYVFIGTVVILGICALISYNRFVKQRQLIDNSWSNVDTELQRRYELIPNLVSTVRGYARHEERVFEEITKARANAVAATGDAEEQSEAENKLVGAMKDVFAVAEGYPDLKASANFLELQNELTNTEDRIQAARRFFNGNVRDYNIRVQSLPSNIIARFFMFQEKPFFQVEPALRDAPAPPTDAF